MTDIVIVGEAWGEKEAEVGLPFQGASGWLLDQMLGHAGLSRKACYVTNVFNLRPKGNDVKTLCGTKAEGIPGLPELSRGKYVRAEYRGELERLYTEIRNERPNVIIALGATAAWALLHSSGIKSIRGAIAPTHPTVSNMLGREYKVLPTYHPAMILRDFSARPIGIADLDKARRESAFPDVRRPSRKVWIYPTLDDLAEFDAKHMQRASLVSIDIETRGDQITCIGFAPDEANAIVIPLFLESGKNYWPDKASELAALAWVRKWCAMPAVFQNGLYDIHFLWRRYGIPVPRATEDTMLLHHAWQPEMEKGLGFLATIYTNEASWKFMRKGLKHD